MEQKIKQVDLIKLIELTVRDVPEKSVSAVQAMLKRFLQASSVKMSAEEIKAAFDELSKVNELEDTVRALEHVVVDANGMSAFCRYLLMFFEQRGRSPEIRSTPRHEEPLKKQEQAFMTTASEQLNRRSSEIEKQAWDLINRS